MRGLLGTKCICTKNTGTKSAGRQKSCLAAAALQCRSHLWKSKTSAFLSLHQTKTVPVRRFFYEIFYWQGLLKQPEPDTQESPISTPPVKNAVSQQAAASTLSPLGEDVSKCQHMQTPVERTWKLTAIFFLVQLSTMHTFSGTNNAARCLNVPRSGERVWPRLPRDGTGWGACVVCLIACRWTAKLQALQSDRSLARCSLIHSLHQTDTDEKCQREHNLSK